MIASAIGGLGERIEDGVNGFTFPARDARALAELMAKLTGNEPEWLEAASGIAPPWTETQMLEAHMVLWAEALERRKLEAAAERDRAVRNPSSSLVSSRGRPIGSAFERLT